MTPLIHRPSLGGRTRRGSAASMTGQDVSPYDRGKRVYRVRHDRHRSWVPSAIGAPAKTWRSHRNDGSGVDPAHPGQILGRPRETRWRQRAKDRVPPGEDDHGHHAQVDVCGLLEQGHLEVHAHHTGDQDRRQFRLESTGRAFITSLVCSPILAMTRSNVPMIPRGRSLPHRGTGQAARSQARSSCCLRLQGPRS
jgi:hypothetical protein